MFEVKVSELTYKAFYFLEVSAKEEKAAYKAIEELPTLEFELSELDNKIKIKNQYVISKEAKAEVAALYKEKSKLTAKINKRKQIIRCLTAPQQIYESCVNKPELTRCYDFSAIEATERIARGCR